MTMFFIGVKKNSLMILFMIVCLSFQIKSGSTYGTTSENSGKSVEDATNLPQTEGSGEITTEYGESNKTEDGNSSKTGTGTETSIGITAETKPHNTAAEDGESNRPKAGEMITNDASYDVTTETTQHSGYATGGITVETTSHNTAAEDGKRNTSKAETLIANDASNDVTTETTQHSGYATGGITVETTSHNTAAEDGKRYTSKAEILIANDASNDVTTETAHHSGYVTDRFAGVTKSSAFNQDSFTISTESSAVSSHLSDGTISEKPRDVKFLNQSETSLIVSWLWSYDNIKADNYVITVFHADLPVTKFTGTLNTTDSPGQQYFYTVQNLSAGMCYNISVTALINSTTGSPQYSDQYGCTLPEMPFSVNATALTNTSIEVMWIWEENAGSVDSFVVTVTSANGTTYVNDVNFTSDGLTSYIVDGLHYGTCYNVSVKAVFRTLSGQIKHILDPICTLPASPKQVFISEDTIRTDGFNIQWTWNSQGEVDNFVIIIQDSEHEQVVGNTSENYTVTKLASGKCFNVSVAAVFNKRKSLFQHTSTCTLPAVPVNLTVLSQNTSSLTISWVQPGGFDNFTLTFVDTTTLIEVNHTTTLTQYSVGQLPPGRCFNVNIVTVFKGRSGNPGQLANKTCTVPLSPLNLSVTGVTSTNLTISWNWKHDRGDVDQFVVIASPVVSSNIDHVTVAISANSRHLNYSSILTSLTPGLCYNLCVSAVLNEQKGESIELASCQYTKPAVPELSFFTYSERTLEISLKPLDGFVDSYMTNISCNTQNPADITVSNNTSIIVSDVLPGSVCIMYITAIRAQMYSQTALIHIRTNETVPGPVSSLRSVKIRKTFIEISWGYPEQPNGNITKYHVQISSTSEGIEEDTVPSSNLTYLFTNLSPGRGYKIEVQAENGAGVGASSAIKVFTREKDDSIFVPGPVDNLSLLEVTSDNFTIQWDLPVEPNGNISHFITFVNSETFETNYDDDRSTYNFTYNGLIPGTCYEITVVAVNNAGEGDKARLHLYTNETAPGRVVETVISNVTSRSTIIKWRRPVKPNGLIVKYTVLIRRESQYDCEQLITVMCIDCKVTCAVDQNNFRLSTSNRQLNPCSYGKVISTNMNFTQDNSSVFSVHLRDLVPASYYNVSIYGHTSAGIGPGAHLEFTTLEDKPSTAVRNITVLNSTSSTITLSFLPPEKPNGQIVFYKIKYFYRQHLCQSEIDTAKIVSSLVYANNTSNPVKVDILNLFSFWEYSFSVVPSTKAGQGTVWSDNITYMTDQSYPSEVDVSSVKLTDITPYKINIMWSKPCYPNGIIIKYLIKISKGSDSEESVIKTVDNTTTYVKNGLLPDSLYQFEIAAETSIGHGNFTTYKQVRTYTDVPYKPRNIYANATGSTSVYVSWTTPALRTGPTNYTVMMKDNVSSSIIKRCHTQGFTNTSCSVYNLEEYWGYTVEVIAHTVNGSNSSALEYIVRTLQAAPGPVRDFKVILPSDVTKPRTVNITWRTPADRDRNGMITKYYLSYHTQKDQVIEIPISADSTFYDNLHLRPQCNYTFEVFAVTVGNGSRKTVQIYIPPGAPQRPDEGNEPLIKHDNLAIVSDKTKQISIQLPVTFLCDKNNGVPVKWGVVVVSELKLIKDEPFWGSSLLFDRERRMSYKSWNQVKNDQLYDAYIAKDFNVQPECPQNYNLLNSLVKGRRRRGVKPSTFIVGGDGDCNGNSDKYCNGYLRPGQKYQVKLYVCTEGGCTETKYSDPIVTVAEAPEESSVMMIIIGILAAIVMFTVTMVVTYFAWRKKIFCFKQHKADEAGKENPGYSPDIEMTDIPYRLVKLANFPEYVEDLQKDSNLRFSEQYKAIRRLSPSHTTNAAEGQCARIKNRYTNILPFDHSRVKLLPLDDEEGSDYINANYMPGYHSKREYIAAQGPLQCTKDDFWRMTWEQNVSVIVMLTQCVERGRRKCESYWPETPHEPVYFGDIIVETDSESTLPDYVIRIMTMKLGQKKRKIKQIHFLKWPDFGCPETTWLLLDFVMAVRLYKPHDMQGPIIVHCSAGVGRTGTFIALDHLLYRIKEHDEIDIFNIVLEMRNYRPSMVQTEDQYIFIHDCISDYLCASDEDEDLQREQVEEYLAEALYENVPRR